MKSGLLIIALLFLTVFTFQIPFSHSETAKTDEVLNKDLEIAGIPPISKGQEPEQDRPVNAVTAPNSTADELVVNFRTDQLRMKLIEVLAIAVAGLIALFLVLRFITNSRHYTADNLIHGGGLVIICFGAILIPTIADTEQQLTATVGVLGAVAGYLFGSMRKGEPHTANQGQSSESKESEKK